MPLGTDKATVRDWEGTTVMHGNNPGPLRCFGKLSSFDLYLHPGRCSHVSSLYIINPFDSFIDTSCVRRIVCSRNVVCSSLSSMLNVYRSWSSKVYANHLMKVAK